MRIVLMKIVAVLGLGLMAAGAGGQPIDETFTYQGKLLESGADANGNYNIRVTLVDQTATAIAGPEEMLSVPVIDGLFSINLNFGGALYSSDRLFLKIEVFEAGVGYVAMSPNTPINATPLAAVAMRSLDNEWSRIGDTLRTGDSNDRFLFNPDLSGGVFINPNTVAQFNTKYPDLGGVYVNSDTFNGIPFYGLSSSGIPLGRIEASPLSGQLLFWNNQIDEPSMAVEEMKVAVAEDLHVGGVVYREFSPDTPMPAGPLAYATIAVTGEVLHGTPNISSIWDNTLEQYHITVDGESFVSGEYIAVVTTQHVPGEWNDITKDWTVVQNGELYVGFKSVTDHPWTTFSIVIYKAAPPVSGVSSIADPAE